MGKVQITLPHSQGGYLYGLLVQGADNHVFWFILSALAIWLQAVMLNYLAIRHKLSERKSWFIAIAYVFLASFWPQAHSFSDVLLSLFFYIPALSQLFGTFRIANCQKDIFNVGFLLGIGALFSSSLLWFVLPFYLGFSSLRSFKLREQLGFLVGLVMPFILAWGAAFLFDDYDRFNSHLHFRVFGLPQMSWPLQPVMLASLALFTVAVLLVMLTSFRYLTKRGIQSQKYFAICYWLLAIAIFIALFRQPFRATYILYLVPPLAIFLGISFEENKNHQVAELIHLLLIAALFSTHFLLTSL